MVDIARPKFDIGRVVATPSALRLMSAAGHSPLQFVNRHVSGDWGAISPADRALNDEALLDGSRILSAYALPGGQRIWVISDAADDRGRRESTTILLPEEY
jgi:hypothetical protein